MPTEGEGGQPSAAPVLVAVPPSVPKPAVAAPSWRHKFINHSIGSLPTTNGTQDSFGGEVVHEEEEDDDRRSCTSGFSLDEEEEEDEGAAPSTHRGGKVAAPSVPLGEGAQPKAPLPQPAAGAPAAAAPAASGAERPAAGDADSAGDSDSEACTDEYPPSTLSELRFDSGEPDVAEELESGPALLNLEEGLQPPSTRTRCPPTSWLVAAGFELPASGEPFESAPVLPVCGERPTRYLNLFCRQMLSRHQTSELTVGALARHDAAQGRVRHSSRPPRAVPEVVPDDGASGIEKLQNADWLEAFVARARAQPLFHAAAHLVGDDIGGHVASFLDALSDASGAAASLGEDTPDGRHVTGHRVLSRHPLQGRGRAGFLVESDVAISTPGRSQSPPPRRPPPQLPAEPMLPPLILRPEQEQRQQQQRRLRGEQRQLWRTGA